MAPKSTTNKAKAAGIGASSFLDLKAELAAKEKEIAGNKSTGKRSASSSQKPGKVCRALFVPREWLRLRFDFRLVAIEIDHMDSA